MNQISLIIIARLKKYTIKEKDAINLGENWNGRMRGARGGKKLGNNKNVCKLFIIITQRQKNRNCKSQK